MTIQEIKEYINSRLGGVLKCVLPSYWWKKFFGIVLDRVEESESQVQKQLDTITARLDEAKSLKLLVDQSDVEGSIKNNIQVFDKIGTKLLLNSMGGKAPDPMYVQTKSSTEANVGKRLLSLVTVRAWILASSDPNKSGIYITAYNVPFGDRITDINFKADGTYELDYQRLLYYRTDDGVLTDEQKGKNSDLANKCGNAMANSAMDFGSIRCFNAADGEQHPVIGMDSALTFYPTFYVMEYNKVVKVKYNSGVNKNDMTTEIIGTLTPAQ
jgi:hypothetical protein